MICGTLTLELHTINWELFYGKLDDTDPQPGTEPAEQALVRFTVTEDLGPGEEGIVQLRRETAVTTAGDFNIAQTMACAVDPDELAISMYGDEKSEDDENPLWEAVERVRKLTKINWLP